MYGCGVSGCLSCNYSPHFGFAQKIRNGSISRQTICSKRGKQNEPEFPSLAKEGWLRPSMKCREATLAGRRRGGSLNLRIDSSGSLDEPPRPRQTRCLRAIFLDGAATPPLPRRGVFASYRFVLNSSTSGALKFLALIWYNTCLNAYDVPSLPSKEAGLYLSGGLVADSFALQPGDQGHHERLFPAAGGSAITVRFRARPARNPDERRHFQE